MNKTYNIAITAARAAGKKILEVYNSPDFKITEKPDHSPLTLADRSAHEVIVSFLKDTPYQILSEEGRNTPYSERSKWNAFWLVDPLDGTKEFIKRNDEFTVNIALIENNQPSFGVVYAPVLDELYVGIPGEEAYLQKANKRIALKPQASSLKPYTVIASRSHMSPETEDYIDSIKAQHSKINIVSKGSSLKLCMVAAGEADEYPRLGPTMEWDIAAATAVVLGAGKTVTIFGTNKQVQFNKENLLNPYFLVK